MEHLRRLETMYLKARVQKMYPGIDISIEDGKARITLPVSEQYFHAADAVHGSVFFRLLDDAAYFACSSKVDDVFLLTSGFHIEFLRPVSSGMLIAEGKITHNSRNLFLATSEITDERGRTVALGKGTFMKSTTPLNQITNYATTS